MGGRSRAIERVIVVVEDEPDLLEVIGALLREEGYAVLSVANPALLEARLSEYQPWIFLLDLMMPLITGIELARLLRKDGHLTTPIVAMSASDGMLSTARASGLFDATMNKPFDLDQLLETIDKYAA